MLLFFWSLSEAKGGKTRIRGGLFEEMQAAGDEYLRRACACGQNATPIFRVTRRRETHRARGRARAVQGRRPRDVGKYGDGITSFDHVPLATQGVVSREKGLEPGATSAQAQPASCARSWLARRLSLAAACSPYRRSGNLGPRANREKSKAPAICRTICGTI